MFYDKFVYFSFEIQITSFFSHIVSHFERTFRRKKQQIRISPLPNLCQAVMISTFLLGKYFYFCLTNQFFGNKLNSGLLPKLISKEGQSWMLGVVVAHR